MTIDNKTTVPNDDELNKSEGTDELEDNTSDSTRNLADDEQDELLDEESINAYIDTLPEEVKSTVSRVFSGMKRYFDEQREINSSLVEDLKEKAERYDRLMASGLLNQFNNSGGKKDNESNLLVDPSELAESATNPTKFAKLLSEAIERKLNDAFEKFDKQKIAPLHSQAEAWGQVAAMDSLYPEWRKSIPYLKDIMTKNSSLDLRTAYERYVLIPNMSKKLSKKELMDNLTTEKKKEAIRNTPLASDKRNVSNKKTYSSITEAIVETLEELQSKKEGK